MTLLAACKLLGMPQPTGTRWIQSGIIRVKGHEGRQGEKFDLSPKQVRELAVLAQLRSLLSLQALREAGAFLRRLGHNPFSDGQFAVLEGHRNHCRLVKLTDKGEAIELLGKGQGQLLLMSLVEPDLKALSR